jgi:hypothetical protein
MGKKATGDHTPEHPPLDDDAHWMPLVEAVTAVIKQTDSMRLAVLDIEKKASDELPVMRRDLTTGERELVQPEFWEVNNIYYDASGRYVRVLPGPKDERRWDIWASDPHDEDGGHVYFVSRSHFERLWPAMQPRANDEEQVPTRAARPGPKPRDDWPRWVARWLILKATEYPKELQNVDALVEEVRDWLEDQEIFVPKDNKEIRRQIADLLHLIRR